MVDVYYEFSVLRNTQGRELLAGESVDWRENEACEVVKDIPIILNQETYWLFGGHFLSSLADQGDIQH
jgi:hypothetical protein